MATKAGTMTAERRSAFWLRGGAALVIATLAVAALVMAVMALRSSAPTRSVQGAAVNSAVYERSQPVTGTGPGLVQLTDHLAYERSQPVTGTGPGLTHISDNP
ncbi:MAG: hypothetical protein ACT4PO_03405 [Actinomycetota bacterium]